MDGALTLPALVLTSLVDCMDPSRRSKTGILATASLPDQMLHDTVNIKRLSLLVRYLVAGGLKVAKRLNGELDFSGGGR